MYKINKIVYLVLFFAKFLFSLEQNERDIILNEHNYLRSLLANGKAKNSNNNFLPTAANMHKIEYDLEIEEDAQDFANNCSWRRHNGNYGMNIDITPGFDKIGFLFFEKSYNLTTIINKWWSNLKHYGYNIEKNIYDNIRSEPRASETFINMAWSETTKIGCGIKFCENIANRKNQYLITCFYKNAFNHAKNLYEIGAPCSKCFEFYPDSICDTKGMGLCEVPIKTTTIQTTKKATLSTKKPFYNINRQLSPFLIF